MRTAAVIQALTLLTACGTTPHTNYYVLSSQSSLAEVGNNPVSLGVGPVLVADYLDRIQITLLQDNAIELSEFHRWGEPLTVGIRRVLMEELAAQLDTVNLVQFPWRADEIPDLRIKMMVLELNRKGNNATMKTAWSLAETRSGETLHQDVVILQEPLSGQSHDALVQGYSRLLYQLASHLSGHIKHAQVEFLPDVESPSATSETTR